ncbi:hypothetical protein GW17_00012102, partial [Ensete ventricosum]
SPHRRVGGPGAQGVPLPRAAHSVAPRHHHPFLRSADALLAMSVRPPVVV